MSRSALFGWISAIGIWVLSLNLMAAAETATSLLERAQVLAWLDNWTEAGPLFAEAEKLFVASGDERNALYARIGRIRFESERMPYAEVSEFFATQLINPVVASDPHLKLWCLAAKGYTDLQIAPLSAKKAWEELMAVAQELGQRQWISRANGELGIIAFLEGDSGKAQRQVGQALQSARSSGDVAAQVRYLSMIGQGVAEIGRFQESLFYFDQALALANTQRDGPYPYIAISGKATALSALKQEAQARQLLMQALEKAKTLGRRGQETDLLRLLGILDEKSDNRAGAVHHYEEAISLATEGQFYRELADTLIRAAKIYQRDGSLDKAEQHAAHGVQVSRKVGDTYFLPRYLTALAEIKAALGKLQVAEALYDEAQDIIRGMLVFVPSLRMKSSLVAAMSDAYLSQFRTNVELLQNPSRAFQVIELARGRTIADVLRSRSLVQGSAPTPVMVQISSLQRRLIESTSRTERKSLVDQIDQAEILMAPETSALWRSRGYLQLADSPVSLEALRKTLSGRELILEYVLTEPNSYCLVVSRDNIQIVRLASGRVIEGNVERYVKEIQEKKVPTSLGQQIFKDLIAPIPNLKSRLIIVPDGKLNNLPFETLPVAPNQFLVHSHQILYCPSSTVLAAISSRAATKKQLAFLGVGDIPYGGEVAETATRGIEELQWKKLQPLPASREEVVTAGHLLGKQPVLLMGPKATEAAFKGQSLERYRVLHLALHGFADLTNPDRASLVFNLDPDPRQDGLLQAREIAGLNLKAELVTLSACNTAVGPMQAQEGIDNLVKAFLIAGARNVIASLWPAEDKFTLALMKQFYAHLAKGKDKAEALQLAKQALLVEFGNDLPPLYWAGFKLIGHGGTLAPGNK